MVGNVIEDRDRNDRLNVGSFSEISLESEKKIFYSDPKIEPKHVSKKNTRWKVELRSWRPFESGALSRFLPLARSTGALRLRLQPAFYSGTQTSRRLENTLSLSLAAFHSLSLSLLRIFYSNSFLTRRMHPHCRKAPPFLPGIKE